MARNPSDFWSRHISLSTWFRDYVYIPGGTGQHWQTVRNLMATMLLAGLWHGANCFDWVYTAYCWFSPIWSLSGLNRITMNGLRYGLALPVMFSFTLVGWAILQPEPGAFWVWFTALGH
jgi:D-alanyl-lipoteichoic acid acyltransferase DltB (MBOAT superfamily)